MHKCEKVRNTNRVIYISYTLNLQFSSFSGMLSAVIERQILKMLYQFHRLLLRNRRLKFPHASDISDACKKYITSTAKIQGGAMEILCRFLAISAEIVYNSSKSLSFLGSPLASSNACAWKSSTMWKAIQEQDN